MKESTLPILRRAVAVLTVSVALVSLTACGTKTTSAPAASTLAPVATESLLAQLQPMLGARSAQVIAADKSDSKLTVKTTLVDPRGASGSAAAMDAIAICEVARTLPGVQHVEVDEADGTAFVLFGHPLVPAGTCGEV